MPWAQFLALWTAMLMGVLLVLTGPVLFVLVLPIAFFEIWGGNIHLLLALAIVLGFRLPVTWSFVLLTKVTPGIGLLWFAARQRMAFTGHRAWPTTAIIAFGSWMIDPPVWRAWIDLLLREATGGTDPPRATSRYRCFGDCPSPRSSSIYAGRAPTGKWLLPVVAFLAHASAVVGQPERADRRGRVGARRDRTTADGGHRASPPERSGTSAAARLGHRGRDLANRSRSQNFGKVAPYREVNWLESHAVKVGRRP